MSPCATDCCWGNALTLCLVFGYKLLYVGAMSTVPKYLKVLMYLTALPMVPCRSGDQPNNPVCRLNLVVKTSEKYEYLEEGDIMIGGVLTVGTRDRVPRNTDILWILPSV
ncbi:hypothetical protein XENTR_v10000064 [Xenopus tropicalis]|nr:hypothetical protein XENTR_v10000064 [Xenopus tropicalis]